MKFKCSFDEKYGEKLLIKRYEGSVSLEDIINSWEETLPKNLLKPHTKGVLTDFLNANLDFKRNDIENLIKYFLSKGDTFRKIRFALLMDEPTQVVMPILAGEGTSEFLSKPFATEEAAIGWIMEGTR